MYTGISYPKELPERVAILGQVTIASDGCTVGTGCNQDTSIGVTTGVQLGNIPHSDQLPSVASLTPAESNTHGQQRQGELLAKLEVSLVSVAEGVGSHSSKVVSLGLGMPAIPKNWWINHAGLGNIIVELPLSKEKSKLLSPVLNGSVVGPGVGPDTD